MPQTLHVVYLLFLCLFHSSKQTSEQKYVLRLCVFP
nr:hypothetical protein YSBCXYJI_YSBCXYJI_CDS_0102 [Caudoviricetes sp.]